MTISRRFGVGERDEALARVAKRGRAEHFAQAPGAPAVVRRRDDRAEVVGVALESPEQDGESGAAADGDEPRAPAADAASGEAADDALAAAGVPCAEREALMQSPRGCGAGGEPEQSERGAEPERPADAAAKGDGGAERKQHKAGGAKRGPPLQSDAGPRKERH